MRYLKGSQLSYLIKIEDELGFNYQDNCGAVLRDAQEL